MTRLLVALAFFTAARLPAADPVAPLKPLVPPDAAVVFVVRDLSATLKALAASPMAAWLAGSPLGKQLVDPKDAQKLVAARDFLTAQLGVTSEELRDGVFGEAVVFAFTPGEPGKPETDVSTLLVRPRDPAALERLIERLNKFEQVTPRAAERNGVRYVVREKAGKASDFYYLRDRVFVLSSREATLHAVLDASVDADRLLPKWLGLDDGGAAVAALFNPRAFDAGWAARAATSAPADRTFPAQFAKVWAGLDGLCLSARLGHDLTLRLTADVADARLPPEWRKLLAAPAGPASGFAAPAGCLLAVNGRFHLKTLLDAAAPFFPNGGDDLRKQLDDAAAPAFGRDDWPAVLATLGPDFTLWVRPAATAATLEAALAVRLGPTPADAARLAPAVRQALDTVAHLWRVDHNRKHADQVALRPAAEGATAENPRGFPAGFAPSYRVSAGDGSAVVATNPGPAAEPATASADAPLLRLSLTACHAYLRDHRAVAAKFLAGYEKRPAADIERELADLLPLLEAGKSLDVRLGRDQGRVTATATVEFVKPLK